MKKLLLATLIIGAAALVSCSKEYTCCLYIDGVKSTDTDACSVSEKMTKKEMKDSVDYYNSQLAALEALLGQDLEVKCE